MNDLDTALRSVANALVEGAPPPPPFPNGSGEPLTPNRPPMLRFVLAAGAAIVVVTSAAAVIGRDNPTRVAATQGDRPIQSHAPASYLCESDPAIRVTVPGATAGPTEGAGPRTAPLVDGQRAVHWMTAEGIVDLRWPARTQPIYDDGNAVTSTLHGGESVSEGRSEIDVAPAPNATDPSRVFDPDVILEAREPATPEPTAPCDLLELTVATSEGRWHSGLRALPSNGEFGMPAERVDLQPRIVERRSVDIAPNAAIRCQGSDQYGTPPNRAGGLDRSIGGTAPADVLLGYLAATPGAPTSGYVEMAETDGSITYGVDASGIGWTTLLLAVRDGDNWYLDGWTASGC